MQHIFLLVFISAGFICLHTTGYDKHDGGSTVPLEERLTKKAFYSGVKLQCTKNCIDNTLTLNPRMRSDVKNIIMLGCH